MEDSTAPNESPQASPPAVLPQPGPAPFIRGGTPEHLVRDATPEPFMREAAPEPEVQQPSYPGPPEGAVDDQVAVKIAEMPRGVTLNVLAGWLWEQAYWGEEGVVSMVHVSAPQGDQGERVAILHFTDRTVCDQFVAAFTDSSYGELFQGHGVHSTSVPEVEVSCRGRQADDMHCKHKPLSYVHRATVKL